MNEEHESDYFLFNPASVRQSQNQAEQNRASWDSLVVSAMTIASAVNPYEPDLPVGTVIPAVEAVNWSIGNRNCDIRPRLLDKSSGKARLLDSGSQISITSKGPDDKLDSSLRLVAVNGSKIDTYGIRTVDVKIGRKTYPIPAVICDIEQDILGMDFIAKFRLNFEWDEIDQSELWIVDRKAQIRDQLQIVTVPTDIPRVHYLDSLGAKPPEGGSFAAQSSAGPQSLTSTPSSSPTRPVNNASVQFEVACMKALEGSDKKQTKLSIEQQLQLHEDKYVRMIRAHPQLLEPSFTMGEPAHGIYHRIDMAEAT